VGKPEGKTRAKDPGADKWIAFQDWQCTYKAVMGKRFWEGAKKKRKKLQAGQCKLLKTTTVHFTKFL
jgi:hypothetical protein